MPMHTKSAWPLGRSLTSLPVKSAWPAEVSGVEHEPRGSEDVQRFGQRRSGVDQEVVAQFQSAPG